MSASSLRVQLINCSEVLVLVASVVVLWSVLLCCGHGCAVGSYFVQGVGGIVQYLRVKCMLHHGLLGLTSFNRSTSVKSAIERRQKRLIYRPIRLKSPT